jgi:hypothetical protein
MKRVVVGELGDFSDNWDVFGGAMMLKDAGATREAYAVLAQLKEHIERTGEIQSRVHLLPRVEDELRRIERQNVRPRGVQMLARLIAPRRRAADHECACSRESADRHNWEMRLLSWALRIIFVLDLAAVLLFFVTHLVPMATRLVP